MAGTRFDQTSWTASNQMCHKGLWLCISSFAHSERREGKVKKKLKENEEKLSESINVDGSEWHVKNDDSESYLITATKSPKFSCLLAGPIFFFECHVCKCNVETNGKAVYEQARKNFITSIIKQELSSSWHLPQQRYIKLVISYGPAFRFLFFL